MNTIKLDDVRIDGGTQCRVVIDQPTVYSYVESMKGGDIFPPMLTVFDGVTYWLVDGFHRYHAYRLMNVKKIDVQVRKGTQLEAQVIALGMNGSHGKPRTNEDKRKCVEMALEHQLTKKMSNTEIARVCAVSVSFVSAVKNPETKARQDKNREKHSRKKSEEKPQQEKGRSPTTTTQPVGDIPQGEPDPNAGAAPSDDEIKAAELAQAADMEAMQRLLDADDKLRFANDEIKRLNHLNAQLTVRLQGLMNEKNEAVKLVKQLRKQLEKDKGKS